MIFWNHLKKLFSPSWLSINWKKILLIHQIPLIKCTHFWKFSKLTAYSVYSDSLNYFLTPLFIKPHPHLLHSENNFNPLWWLRLTALVLSIEEYSPVFNVRQNTEINLRWKSSFTKQIFWKGSNIDILTLTCGQLSKL